MILRPSSLKFNKDKETVFVTAGVVTESTVGRALPICPLFFGRSIRPSRRVSRRSARAGIIFAHVTTKKGIPDESNNKRNSICDVRVFFRERSNPCLRNS